MRKGPSELTKWKAAYQAAVLEADDAKIMRRIVNAEEAIGRRLQVGGKLNAGEAQAIYYAILRLHVLASKTRNGRI